MNQTMHVPPAERDVPAGRHHDQRRHLLEYASQSSRVRRSFVVRQAAPFAAAASVVAIAATAGLMASRTHQSSLKAGHQLASATISDATLAERCGLPGAQVLVRFDDELGSYAVIGRDNTQRDCQLAPDGTVFGGPPSTGGHESTYSAGGAELQTWGDSAVPGETATGGDSVIVTGLPSGCTELTPGSPAPANAGARCTERSAARAPGWRNGEQAFGTIGRNTVRVVITWVGRAPITAAIRGPYFAARTYDAAGLPLASPANFRIQAYDAQGNLLTDYVQQI